MRPFYQARSGTKWEMRVGTMLEGWGLPRMYASANSDCGRTRGRKSQGYATRVAPGAETVLE